LVVLPGGSNPADNVNSAAVAAMVENGIDISAAPPRRWTNADLDAADIVVTMGCGDTCPVVPATRYVDWNLADPDGLSVDGVRPIRHEIEQRVRTLLDDLGVGPKEDRASSAS
jgi:protein-tyrosine-phosphatase